MTAVPPKTIEQVPLLATTGIDITETTLMSLSRIGMITGTSTTVVGLVSSMASNACPAHDLLGLVVGGNGIVFSVVGGAV